MLCPCKGDSSDYSVEVVSDFIRQTGLARFVHNSDQEASIKVLKTKAIEKLAGTVEAIPEESPVGAHQANGSIENGVLQMEGIVRTQRDALEQSQGIRVEHDSPLVPWLVLWSAFVWNRFSVDMNGRTPYERVKGKPFKRELVPFGERVYWLPLTKAQRGQHMNKLENKWRIGHFLGIREGSDEA